MFRAGRATRGFHIAKTLYQPLGLDCARRQSIDADILRRVIGRHRFGKLDQRALARAISRAPRSGNAAQLRRNMNDAATARRDHRR